MWANECKRCFEDRFINSSDITIFRKYLHEGLAKSFGEPDEKNNPLTEVLKFILLKKFIKKFKKNLKKAYYFHQFCLRAWWTRPCLHRSWQRTFEKSFRWKNGIIQRVKSLNELSSFLISYVKHCQNSQNPEHARKQRVICSRRVRKIMFDEIRSLHSRIRYRLNGSHCLVLNQWPEKLFIRNL